jgi:hypothetical protein
VKDINRLNYSMKIFKNNISTLFFIIIIAFSSLYIYYSDWFYFIDEGVHYLYSRFALDTTQAIIDPWHRIGRVFLFFIPAQFGPIAVKIAGSLIFLLVLYYLYKIIKIYKIEYGEFIILFVGLQPVFFDVSFTCLAEVPTAFLIIFSFYSYLKKNYKLCIITSSLIILFRYEMFFFSVLITLIIIIETKNYKYFLLLLIGPFLWETASYVFTSDLTKIFVEFQRFSRLEKYTEGVAWYHYFYNSPVIFGVLQSIFFVVGVFVVLQKKILKDKYIILTTIIITIIINTFSASKYFHFSGSVGDLRYLAPIAPFWGLISVIGFSFVVLKIKNRIFVDILLFLITLLLIFNCVSIVKPHNMDKYYKTAVSLVEQIKTTDPKALILGNCYVIPYVLDEPPTGGEKFKILNKDNIMKYNLIKHYILWDPRSGNSAFSQRRLKLEELIRSEKYKIINIVESNEGNFYLFLNSQDF